jgi:prepilin-type N-terminal cleavage/methylation domain-containing protein
MISPRKHSGVRRGLSLLEVLVALIIFLLAFVALGHLVTVGGDLALETQQQVQAADLCQTKMAEVIAGAVPLTPQSAVPFEEDPAWQWSLDCEQNNFPGLWNVTVQVSRQQVRGTHVVCRLSEMVLDPQKHGSLQDLPPGGSTSGDSSSSGSSPSSSGGTGAAAMGGK